MFTYQTILKILSFGFILNLLIIPNISAQTGPILNLEFYSDKNSVQPGETFTYTLHCWNPSHRIAYHLRLEHYLPENISIEDVSYPMIHFSERKIVFDLQEMLPNEGQTIFVKVKAKENTRIGTILESKAFLYYSNTFEENSYDPIIYKKTEVLVKRSPYPEKPLSQKPTLDKDKIPIVQAAEVAVGAENLFINFIISLIAGVFAFILILFYNYKINKLAKT